MSKRIVVVDDHDVVRQGVRLILRSRPEWSVVDEASNGNEAVRKIKAQEPDLTILDISMPEKDGLEVIRDLKAAGTMPKVLVLSMHNSKELIAAVRTVANNEAYISPGVSSTVLSDYQRFVGSPLDLLTARENDVFRLLAEGKTSKDIASELDISVYTVDAHRSRIMRKLQLRTIGDLVRFAIQRRLVPLEG